MHCNTCKIAHFCTINTIAAPCLYKSRVEQISFDNRNIHLCKAGQPLPYLYIVLSGSLKSYSINIDGDEQILDFYQPGEVIGLESINDGFHPYSIKTLQAAVLCQISLESIECIRTNYPDFNWTLMKLMAGNLQKHRTLIAIQRLKRVDSRLAAYFLSISRSMVQQGFASQAFALSMTRGDIAGYLNTKIETISRIFTKFQQKGLISVNRNFIKLNNRVALEKLATPGKTS